MVTNKLDNVYFFTVQSLFRNDNEYAAKNVENVAISLVPRVVCMLHIDQF